MKISIWFLIKSRGIDVLNLFLPSFAGLLTLRSWAKGDAKKSKWQVSLLRLKYIYDSRMVDDKVDGYAIFSWRGYVIHEKKPRKDRRDKKITDMIGLKIVVFSPKKIWLRIGRPRLPSVAVAYLNILPAGGVDAVISLCIGCITGWMVAKRAKTDLSRFYPQVGKCQEEWITEGRNIARHLADHR